MRLWGVDVRLCKLLACRRRIQSSTSDTGSSDMGIPTLIRYPALSVSRSNADILVSTSPHHYKAARCIRSLFSPISASGAEMAISSLFQHRLRCEPERFVFVSLSEPPCCSIRTVVTEMHCHSR